jgi:hypothetical protein
MLVVPAGRKMPQSIAPSRATPPMEAETVLWYV